jgi:hypothetical protein
MKSRFSISRWLRRKRRDRPTPGGYFTVLFDPEGRLMVCEDGVWKIFELDATGRPKAGNPA